MTCNTGNSLKHSSTHGCCGSHVSEDRAALPAAVKPEVGPLSETERATPAGAAGSCCHGDGGHCEGKHQQHGTHP